ncbi:MAG: hypothetical protein KF833_18510 [Verrucomicrobiae bacterium]|nr:hypothetical protein [Verrucomicrobiae bacterium]
MTPNTCEHCRWWHEWPQQPNPKRRFGECRHSRPVLASMTNGSGVVSKWPSTGHQDWCGDFMPRTGAAANFSP